MALHDRIADWPINVRKPLSLCGRPDFRDVLLLVLLVLFGLTSAFGESIHLPEQISFVAAVCLAISAVIVLYRQVASRADFRRALQSDRMLRIASESIIYLRRGLDAETAQAVCEIALNHSQATAVAITDSHAVLGFAGPGRRDCHPEGPILANATREALMNVETRVVRTKYDIGGHDTPQRLRSAIVVPLLQLGEAVGALKLYYESDKMLNETQFAMAEGLSWLLSTQLELAQLEHQTELARTMELKALQAQINPHFLFNMINTIASFVRTDPPEAHRLLRQFGIFYRQTLEGQNDLITVEQEILFISTYFELEQARFGKKIALVVNVSPEVRSYLIPAFMLQPLVENSIAHGMRGDGASLTITVTGVIAQGRLLLSVSDNGSGISSNRLAEIYEPAAGDGSGVALRNIRDRLLACFGPGSDLSIQSVDGQGVVVSMVIPASVIARA